MYHVSLATTGLEHPAWSIGNVCISALRESSSMDGQRSRWSLRSAKVNKGYDFDSMIGFALLPFEGGIKLRQFRNVIYAEA